MAILVYYREDHEDLKSYLYEFKRACVANQDMYKESWLLLFLDFLEYIVEKWYKK